MVISVAYSFDISSIIVAFVSVSGVIITSIFGFIKYKHNKWSEYVSKERMKWIKEFRTEVGKILKAYAVIRLETDENIFKIILEAEEARYVLITRINTNKVEGNEYNFEYKKILMNIDFNENSLEKFDLERFLTLTNNILEAEWQKVKRKAKGEM